MTPARFIAAFVAAALIAFAGWLGLAVGDRSFPTLVEHSELLTPHVRPGGEMLTRRSVDRQRLCHTTIERMMFDSRDVRFDLKEIGLGTIVYPNGSGPLGRDTFIGKQTVPSGMAPGPARYVALVCYRCNWLQWIWPLCEPPREQRFVVDARP